MTDIPQQESSVLPEFKTAKKYYTETYLKKGFENYNIFADLYDGINKFSMEDFSPAQIVQLR